MEGELFFGFIGQASHHRRLIGAKQELMAAAFVVFAYDDYDETCYHASYSFSVLYHTCTWTDFIGSLSSPISLNLMQFREPDNFTMHFALRLARLS